MSMVLLLFSKKYFLKCMHLGSSLIENMYFLICDFIWFKKDNIKEGIIEW
jgi:hypothetical protein